MPNGIDMLEASDLQAVFRESIDDLIAQINQLELSLGIPLEGEESSACSFDGMWKEKDHSQFPPAVYLGMARFLLEMVGVVNTKSNGGLIRLILKVLGLVNQCVATARAVGAPKAINGQLFREFAELRHAEIVANGKKGSEKRHGDMRDLRSWAIEKYKARKWASANEAACALMGEILDHGRTINAVLKPSNAQRTIAEWFRKSV